ncbi:hypothetical protein PybrP1_001643 [[Pythium] brassicae (nom. inval.)]|nr:hypothetical protein PybrP1_001643 [[Pythium] brassicae (nom. inval.)]
MEYVKGVTSDNDLYALFGTYIIFIGKSDVGHWVVYDRGYYFDSYRLPSFKEIRCVNSNAKQYQDLYGQFLGPYCVLYLYCKQKEKMHLLKRFIALDIYVV